MVSESGRARKGPGCLVARVSSHTVDVLAAFQSERADPEAGGGGGEPSLGDNSLEVDAEEDTADDEPDHHNEYDHVLNEPI
jgi:hypothetical protein